MDKKFLTSFLVYGGTTGFARILPITMLPIYLSSLGSTDYGVVEVVFAIFNCLLIFGLLQLETSLQRLYYKVDNQADLFSTIILITFLASILIVVIAYFLSGIISDVFFNTVKESGTVELAALCVVFANIATICMIVLRYMDKAILFTFLSLGQAFLTAIFSYYFIVKLNMGPTGYFGGLLSGWVFLAFTSFLIVFKKLGLNFRLEYIGQALSFSMPQFPARLASFFVQYANRFFVLSILGVQAVALMSLSLKFSALFQLLMLAFSMAWNPFLYKNESNIDLNHQVNKIFKCLLIVLIFIHSIMLFFSDYIITNFFSDEFSEAGKYVVLAIIPFQLLVIKEVVESGVKLANKTKYISISYFISAIFSGFLMLFSSSIMEILLSSVFGNLLLVLLLWYFSIKNYHLTYSRVWFFGYFLFVLLSVLISTRG